MRDPATGRFVPGPPDSAQVNGTLAGAARKKKNGLYLTSEGYLRITAGPDRNKMAHRAYVERQVGRKLRVDEEVDHLCKNRSCWPPTDFSPLHHGLSGKKRRR